MTQQQGRQAVVIVHGMGEQKPMATAAGFVTGLTGEHDIVHSAPDRVSDRRDLRRVKVTWLPRLERPNDRSVPAPPARTDFYELYWANLVSGTERHHVVSWLMSLLPRWRTLTPRFRAYLVPTARRVQALAVLLAAILVGIYWQHIPDVLRWACSVLISLAGFWIVRNVGDVARYFHKVADNVTTQRAIRSEGVALLRRLHEKSYPGSDRPLYDRIVVVGHSLGSVVAYDIVRDYWLEVHRFYRTSDTTDPDALACAEAVDRAGENLRTRSANASDADRAAFWRAQRDLSATWPAFEFLPPGESGRTRWAVTDLVTLACPLTHADVLVASGATALKREEEHRDLPTCPPVRQSLSPTYRFSYTRGGTGTRSWHQAAPFAATRWTNVYFTSDVVGGPLRGAFGQGIDDIEVADPSGRPGRFPAVHTRYDSEENALQQVRRVIWDGSARRPPASIETEQRRTLLHVVRELHELPAGSRAPVISSTPLLRRYQAPDREVLLAVASTERDLAGALDDAIELHPGLLAHVSVAAELLTPINEDRGGGKPEERGRSLRPPRRRLPRGGKQRWGAKRGRGKGGRA